MIKVGRQWNSRTKELTPPKLGKERVFPVPPIVRDHLQRWLADLPNRERHVESVVTSPQGRMLRYDNFRRDWYRALDRAGYPRVGTHELRRHAASWLVNEWGVPTTDAADILGNTPEVLERHYRKQQTSARLAEAVSHIDSRQADRVRLSGIAYLPALRTALAWGDPSRLSRSPDH